MNRSSTESIFRPDVAPAAKGGIVLHQNGQRIVIEDGEVELFIDDMRAVRKRQLIEDCCRIAGAA